MVNEVNEGRPEISSTHFIAGGVYAKQLNLPFPGDYVESHQHNYDHLSFLASGVVDVEVDGTILTFAAPAGISIQAGKVHKITARAYGVVWLCIHKIPDGEETPTTIEQALIQTATTAQSVDAAADLAAPQGAVAPVSAQAIVDVAPALEAAPVVVPDVVVPAVPEAAPVADAPSVVVDAPAPAVAVDVTSTGV